MGVLVVWKKSIDQFIKEWADLDDKVKATKELTKFYINARFKPSKEEFEHRYVDGGYDGGIDYCCMEPPTLFIFQSKFEATSKQMGYNEIENEIKKIKGVISGNRENEKAEDFVCNLRREVQNSTARLEIILLTTNHVRDSIREEIQKNLDGWVREKRLKIQIDFLAIDKKGLENVIYDMRHGYIPYTGKKTLKLESKNWIIGEEEDTKLKYVLGLININELLGWFSESNDIEKYLQKNVRGFLGNRKSRKNINKRIGKSYLDSPDWFWFKHNGIIAFADEVRVDKGKEKLTMRNPQIVNGGQTISSIFRAYDRNGRHDNEAKVLLRVYRIPYESEVYKRSIDIISALNSQNKINASDLHSTDPRQVRLEDLFGEIGYRYLRKQSKDVRSNKRSISMKYLALKYYVCKTQNPGTGVTGTIEGLFEEENRYEEIFNETEIYKEVNRLRHIIYSYVTAWSLSYLVDATKLRKREGNIRQYAKWYVLSDIYSKLMDWRSTSNIHHKDWCDFIESKQFAKQIHKYSANCFKIVYDIVPEIEDPRKYLKSSEAKEKFWRRTSKRQFRKLVQKAHDEYSGS